MDIVKVYESSEYMLREIGNYLSYLVQRQMDLSGITNQEPDIKFPFYSSKGLLFWNIDLK